MPEAMRAAATGDLPPGSSKQVTLKGTEVALFNAGGSLYAVDNACPHRGGPLSDGALDGTTVTCPWHAWEFDLRTGACLNNPAARVRCYGVQAQGDDLLVTI